MLLKDAYLKQSLDILVEFAALLSFQLWRKGENVDEDQAFTNLGEAVFKLTLNGRFKVAERLADFGLNLKGAKVTDNTRRMLVVNRASALRHDKREDEAIALLDTVDWSATSNVFKLCVAAVRADKEAFIAILPKLKGSDEIIPRSFVDWPCFEFVRQNDEVRASLIENFGESAVKTVQKDADNPTKAAAETKSQAATDSSDTGPGTVH